jgi:hypothetical protein
MLFFLKERSYEIVKLFINQIVLSVFGTALTLAAAGENRAGLRVGSSIFAILFYLFIIYFMMWELGAKDSHKIERKDEGQTRAAGLYMGLVASSVNFLLAILIMLGSLIQHEAFGSIGAVSKLIALLTEGMYTGVLAITVNGSPLNNLWPIYFALPLPLLLVAGLSYYAGSKNFRIFGK